MIEAVMSADVLHSSDQAQPTAREEAREYRPTEAEILRGRGWNPEKFAREQIRGLVLQLFFSNGAFSDGARPLRQVVFSALEPEIDVRSLCWRVGETLARETPGSVAMVGRYPRLIQREATLDRGGVDRTSLRRIATRVRGNLWLLPDRMGDGELITATSLYWFLNEVRSQFEYSIVQGLPAGESNQATAMAQCADGIILVLSAERTRRAAARKVKETLEHAHVRLLGTILDDRVFPVPEPIYRRL